ncbi:helix-turn-helix domain-containing protein [Chitinophaga sp. GCM10012297]|uniref:Helix-turn-helix transcriptional regulator n=1 Tax=Chitinophaga chungangae TaxID=2821488 RepID=A0ABS3YF69_9BACT|nr:helix-turn-helix transcriptional regulator [Chitinophaga chungangae]MBO9153318.1 helix-turn-helix transcriptional regulator [Chitinophaga chungangae]
MEKIQSLEEFYRLKQLTMPSDISKEVGHFNVFNAREFVGHHAKPLPYSRKDFYKVALVSGRNRYFFADKTIDVEEHALMFANPQVPYQCEPLDERQSGYFCIFTDAFFHHFNSSRLAEFPLFRPGGQPVVFLPQSQVGAVKELFEKMLAEIHSDYQYKYDLLRNYAMELIHMGMKLQPIGVSPSHSNAASRISTLFSDLLERQFPIESPLQQVNLRTAIDFASQLSVHVNHLNKALKDATGKSTSELIAERLVQEAKALLKHTDWNVSEIGYCLGFQEPAHFNNFFKKKTQVTPRSFRAA